MYSNTFDRTSSALTPTSTFPTLNLMNTPNAMSSFQSPPRVTGAGLGPVPVRQPGPGRVEPASYNPVGLATVKSTKPEPESSVSESQTVFNSKLENLFAGSVIEPVTNWDEDDYQERNAYDSKPMFNTATVKPVSSVGQAPTITYTPNFRVPDSTLPGLQGAPAIIVPNKEYSSEFLNYCKIAKVTPSPEFEAKFNQLAGINKGAVKEEPVIDREAYREFVSEMLAKISDPNKSMATYAKFYRDEDAFLPEYKAMLERRKRDAHEVVEIFKSENAFNVMSDMNSNVGRFWKRGTGRRSCYDILPSAIQFDDSSEWLPAIRRTVELSPTDSLIIQGVKAIEYKVSQLSLGYGRVNTSDVNSDQTSANLSSIDFSSIEMLLNTHHDEIIESQNNTNSVINDANQLVLRGIEMSQENILTQFSDISQQVCKYNAENINVVLADVANLARRVDDLQNVVYSIEAKLNEQNRILSTVLEMLITGNDSSKHDVDDRVVIDDEDEGTEGVSAGSA